MDGSEATSIWISSIRLAGSLVAETSNIHLIDEVRRRGGSEKHIMVEIVILTQFFPPETGAGARRVGAIAQALAKHHEVAVVAPKPGYPSPDLFPVDSWIESDRDFPAEIERAPRFSPYTKSLVLRASREIWMAFRLFRMGLKTQGKVVIASTPSMFIAPFGALLARLSQARFVWDLRDFTWRYGLEAVALKTHQALLAKAVERLMIAVLRRSDFVITTVDQASEMLSDRYQVSAEKVWTMLNGVPHGFFAQFEGSAVGLDEPPRVMYLGLLGHLQGVDILVDVAQHLPDVQFEIVGDGSERSTIEDKIERMGVENVKLVGYLTSEDRIVEAYRRSDILIIHAKDSPVLNQAVMPSKLAEYMATGRPVIFAGLGVARQVIEDADCGLACPPSDPEAIARAIRQLVEDPGRMREMGRSGRNYAAAHFLRESLCARLVQEMEERRLLSHTASKASSGS